MEVCAIFTRALKAIDAEPDPAQRAQLANLTAALGFTYEKGRRGGDAAPTSWSSTDHLSRHTIRGLVRSEADFVALVQAGSVAELVNPPKSKTSTHSSEVARRTTTLPLIFDLLATQPFSMRVLGPLLWLHDRVDNDLAETPAFRDADGDCVMPGNLRLFLTPSRNIVSISDLGVRDLFRSNLTSPLLVRGPHYTHVYLLHAVYSQTLFTC